MRYQNLHQIREALTLPIEGRDTSVKGFAVDSRKLVSGQVFAALGGEKTDGHQFLRQAKKAGSAAALVSKDYTGSDYGLPLLRVPDPLAALQALAKKAVETTRIIGVTGSVGKTTCKEFIAAILKTRFKAVSSPGNQNTKIGLPLSILNHSGYGEEFLVLEMGMSETGDIAKLIEIAPPEIAVLTFVSLAHSMNFNSLEEIALAKGDIFSHPKTRIGVMPGEAVAKEALKTIGACEKRTFSVTSPLADFYLSRTRELHHKGRFVRDLHVNLKARHHLHNAAAAIAAAKECGLEWEEISVALPLLEIPQGRGEYVEKGGVLFVNDSYNASPESMKAAVESLPSPKKGGKKIAVLGEMLELGRFSEEAHLEIGAYALGHVDRLFCLGESYEVLKNKEGVVIANTREELMDCLKLNAGDVVLLKGSNSCRMWEILDSYL